MTVRAKFSPISVGGQFSSPRLPWSPNGRWLVTPCHRRRRDADGDYADRVGRAFFPILTLPSPAWRLSHWAGDRPGPVAAGALPIEMDTATDRRGAPLSEVVWREIRAIESEPGPQTVATPISLPCPLPHCRRSPFPSPASSPSPSDIDSSITITITIAIKSRSDGAARGRAGGDGLTPQGVASNTDRWPEPP